MKRFFLFFSVVLSSHAQILHHQTLVSQGNSFLTTSGVYVSQSIGQQSIAGSISRTGYTLQQGFQQSLFFQNNWNNTTISVAAKVYPNPFISTLNFEFSFEVKGEVEILFFDDLGRLVYSSKSTPQENRLTITPLQNLSEGHYFVSLSADNLKYSTHLIKSNL